jgi:hypothetical protein
MPPALIIIKLAKVASLTLVLLFLLVWSQQGHTQTPPPKGQDQPDVLRVYTELVQTDVMVFDRQGNFVNGLKRREAL